MYVNLTYQTTKVQQFHQQQQVAEIGSTKVVLTCVILYKMLH